MYIQRSDHKQCVGEQLRSNAQHASNDQFRHGNCGTFFISEKPCDGPQRFCMYCRFMVGCSSFELDPIPKFPKSLNISIILDSNRLIQ